MNITPVFLESDKGQSGAICLAMVLGYYNSYPKLNVVKTACNTGSDEILPENLNKAALRFNFNAKINRNCKLYSRTTVLSEGRRLPRMLHHDIHHRHRHHLRIQTMN